jgi:hypothetical protein
MVTVGRLPVRASIRLAKRARRSSTAAASERLRLTINNALNNPGIRTVSQT